MAGPRDAMRAIQRTGQALHRQRAQLEALAEEVRAWASAELVRLARRAVERARLGGPSEAERGDAWRDIVEIEARYREVGARAVVRLEGLRRLHMMLGERLAELDAERAGIEAAVARLARERQLARWRLGDEGAAAPRLVELASGLDDIVRRATRGIEAANEASLRARVALGRAADRLILRRRGTLPEIP